MPAFVESVLTRRPIEASDIYPPEVISADARQAAIDDLTPHLCLLEFAGVALQRGPAHLTTRAPHSFVPISW
jgi:hypothetical protein